MSTRVLALPKYDRLGASSRLRTLQFIPALQDNSIELDVRPLLDDAYITGLYRGRISRLGVARGYASRLRQIMRAGSYDVVWTEKELLPWLPDSIELSLLPAETRLVVDYDDAVFHRYDQHRSRLVRRIFGRKIDAVMRRADLVLVGNSYLADRALSAGARRVEWLPTVIDLDRYPLPPQREGAGEIIIGWIGTPSTAPYLRLVAPVLERLRERYPVRCVAIGARSDQLFGTPFEAWEWQENTEVAMISSFDIGVMPLPDELFERGKCGYKLIQYMACGLPVVASPVGANSTIVVEDINGYLADSHDQWDSALSRLTENSALRRRLGQVGRLQVEETYSLQAQAPRLADLLRSVGEGDRT
ncbi:glycosyltransferase family 4 protein [Luteimonas fraxinea]|uniref:Glycosyltransferase family 4 protein n=1 Tax=Luteimonas fraxinea TaxID=2901869 RepID=A0ABS8UDV3_9GAMM|nr:glycosyltransferase family 4 protein [Luteimonas fraxinea]MCD9097671.1 glycosyltransferase family 4 protein [Luteimonas fraxinea]MCD9124787.1 glycosyltransferase family 4 protein [Luteimonas fraxinea]UHH08570.1 glycosyltransferase family 4 protein [Luteimonas fraxinea]